MSAGRFVAELRRELDPLWESILAHPFVRGIADGTIARRRFSFYLRQDYIYLIDFSRVLAIACAKAESLDEMRRFSSLLDAILTGEMELPRRSCRGFGIAEEELALDEPAPATRAYSDWLLRTAYEGDLPDILAAVLPCAAGYVEIAGRMRASGMPEPQFCRDWIETYSTEEMKGLAGWLEALLDRRAEGAGPDRRKRWRRLYGTSARMEFRFFDAAWTAGTAEERVSEERPRPDLPGNSEGRGVS